MKWIEQLRIEFKKNGDNIDNMESTLTEEELNREFGILQGPPFVAWGDKYVYYSTTRQGAEFPVDSVASVPRFKNVK